MGAGRAQRHQAVQDTGAGRLRHLVVARVGVVAEVERGAERAAGLAQHLEALAVEAGLRRQPVRSVEDHDFAYPDRLAAAVDQSWPAADRAVPPRAPGARGPQPATRHPATTRPWDAASASRSGVHAADRAVRGVRAERSSRGRARRKSRRVITRATEASLQNRCTSLVVIPIARQHDLVDRHETRPSPFAHVPGDAGRVDMERLHCGLCRRFHASTLASYEKFLTNDWPGGQSNW